MQTMADYMSEHYASYDSFDAGIRVGAEVPPSLRLFVEGSYDGYIHESQAIVEYWEALSALRVDFENPVPKEDGMGDYIDFTFDSHREIIPFRFCSSAYADFSNGYLYPVADPSEVDSLVGSLRGLCDEEKAASSEEVPFENGAYLWDADGDGNPEHLTFDFNDNGDEARSGMVVSLRGYVTDIHAEAYLDGTYQVTGLALGQDDRGSYLLVSYDGGDYYSHDNPAECKLRYVDGVLEVEQ